MRTLKTRLFFARALVKKGKFFSLYQKCAARRENFCDFHTPIASQTPKKSKNFTHLRAGGGGGGLVPQVSPRDAPAFYCFLNLAHRFFAPAFKMKTTKTNSYPCRLCKLECTVDCVECDSCLTWVHSKCENLSKADIRSLSDNMCYFNCSECCLDEEGFFYFKAGLKRMNDAANKTVGHFKAACISEKIASRRQETPSSSKTAPNPRGGSRGGVGGAMGVIAPP